MVSVVGLGAGGHAKVVIDILNLLGGYQITGLLDPKKDLHGTKVLEVPVLGDDDLLEELHNQGIGHAFIGLGSIGDTAPRRRLYLKAREHGFQIVGAIHPNAVVASSAVLGHGPTVLAGVVINADARLGDNVIVNTGAIVEHDCVIEDHVHIATGASLASSVRVGSGAHIGAGAIVRQLVTIGESTVVGAGAVVVKNLPANVVVAGVPAREL